LGVRSQGWKLDWRKFRQYLKNKYSVSVAYLFIGYKPGNESLYADLQKMGYKVILTGDFNTTEIEEKHYNEVFKQSGFKDSFDYAQTMGMNLNAPGSHFFKKDRQWNRLDHIYFSNSLLSEKKFRFFDLMVRDFASKIYQEQKIPFATNLETSSEDAFGFSDHFPMQLILDL